MLVAGLQGPLGNRRVAVGFNSQPEGLNKGGKPGRNSYPDIRVKRNSYVFSIFLDSSSRNSLLKNFPTFDLGNMSLNSIYWGTL
jgi:hypothetical protein